MRKTAALGLLVFWLVAIAVGPVAAQTSGQAPAQPQTAPQQAAPQQPAPKPEASPDLNSGDLLKQLDDLLKGEMGEAADFEIGLIALTKDGLKLLDVVLKEKSKEQRVLTIGKVEISEIGVNPKKMNRFYLSCVMEGITFESPAEGKSFIDKIEIKGLDIDSAKDRYRLELGKIVGVKSKNPLSPGGLGGLEIRNFDLNGEKSFHLGAFIVNDLVGEEGAFGKVDMKNLTLAGIEIEDLEDPAAYGIGRIGVQELSMTQGGKPLFSLAALVSDVTRDDKVITSDISLEKLVIGKSVPSKEVMAMMTALGRDTITFNARLAGYWNRETGLSETTDFRIWADDLGALTAEAKADNIKLTSLTDDAAVEKALSEMNVILARLTYRDSGLFNIIMELAAKEEGKTKEDMIKQTTEELRQGAKEMGPAVVAMAEEAIKFMTSPKALHIVLAPALPISLNQLQKLPPPEMVKALNMAVAAE